MNGLVTGKFYPPHRGHHDLIRLAAQECDRVCVVVVAASVESIPLADRVAWLRAEHASEPNVTVAGVLCDAPVDVTDEIVWRAQVAAIAAGAWMAGTPFVDLVYSAEDYGDELASRFGAEHRRVERSGPSGTAARLDISAGWPTLAGSTRAGLAVRAVFVGAESTGTTTVSREVASVFQGRAGVWADTQWVAEYGREFTEIKWERSRAVAVSAGVPVPSLDEIVWGPDDFDEVAMEQTRRETLAASVGSPVLICDTDAFATAIWERRYLGAESRTSQPWACSPALPRHDVYLLTDHEDVPWHDDGLREGDLEIRAEMTRWFADSLTARGASWVLLTGSLDQRIELAVRTIDQVRAARHRFTAPLSGPGFEHCSSGSDVVEL